MKKNINYFVLLILLIGITFTGFQVYKKSLHKICNGYYTLTVDGINGDKSTEPVTFTIEEAIIDSLKIDKQQVKFMCETSVLLADNNVKYPPTYAHDKNAYLFYDKEGGEIYAMVSGTAKNGYGVPDDVSTTIYFDLNGNVKEDTLGGYKISSF